MCLHEGAGSQIVDSKVFINKLCINKGNVWYMYACVLIKGQALKI